MAMFGYMTELDAVEGTETQEIRAEGEKGLSGSLHLRPAHPFSLPPPLVFALSLQAMIFSPSSTTFWMSGSFCSQQIPSSSLE